jgi:hypothetical protein
MSVVALTLLTVMILAAIGLLAAMYVKDKPWYGALSLFLLLGPATVLAFVYVTLTLS